MKQKTRTHQIKCSFLAATFVVLARSAWPQTPNATLTSALNSEQIVEKMERHDKAQTEELESYHAFRHYEVVYRGFFRTITAEMDVEINYSASSGKSFRIVSESGSHALCERVLKRAVDSEQESSRSKEATALTEENYRFRLLGSGDLGNRPAYILEVQPLTPSKFLYRGKVWVDATDFALAKLEVQPAKNPSFWISQTLIHHTYAQTGGFWLPQQNRSETKVRIGGTAVLTIDYGTYQIVPKQARRIAGPSDEPVQILSVGSSLSKRTTGTEGFR
jgi:hypothetical protein